MSMQAISIHQAVPVLPTVDPSTIDPNKWPLREADDFFYEPWWTDLGEDGRSEYAAAMDDIQSAEVKEDGTLVTSERTFRFWSREKNYRPYLTRLDWTAPDGQTYAFTYEPDKKLRDLADIDPMAAGKELSRRFAVGATDPAADLSDIENLLHAAAIRGHFVPEATTISRSATIEVDPWTETFVIEGEGHEPIDTHIPAKRRYEMMRTLLEGPRTDKQLLMSPAVAEGSLGYGTPFEGMAREQFLQLAAEVNAILDSVEVPPIDPQWIIDRMPMLKPYVTAFEQLTDHLAGSLKHFCDPYGMDVFAESDDGEFAIPMLRELATATKFENGAITTSGADYILKSDPDEPGMLLIEKVDGTDEDFSLYFAKFEIADIEPDSNAMLAFIKGLHARSIHSLSETQFHDAMTIFKILTLATNELVLARHSETQHDEQIELGAHVGVSMNGQIQIQVGDYDFVTHLDSLAYTSPIQIGDDCEMSGVFVQYRQLFFDEHVSGMAAANLRASATAVFEHFKLDVKKIEAGVDVFYRFSGA